MHTHIIQGCTNAGRQDAVANKFCTMALNICGSSVWNLGHVTFLAPSILKCFIVFFGKFVHP
jgi:hypothetical protein